MLKRTPQFRALLGLVVFFFSVGAMASVRADRKSVQTERNTESIQQIAFNQGLCLVTGVFQGADPEKVSMVGMRVDEKRIIVFSPWPSPKSPQCFGLGFNIPEQVEVVFPDVRLPFFLPVTIGVGSRSARDPENFLLVIGAQLPGLPVVPPETLDGELKAGMAVWMPEMTDGQPFWNGEKRLTGTVTPKFTFQPNEPDVHPASGAPVFDGENRLVGIFLRDDWGDDPRQQIYSLRKILEIVAIEEAEEEKRIRRKSE